ncbi:NAD(P)H-dependent oxidoreductase [Roseibacillus persicicus]|uniref:NAD(P)H-dependent oxidoreductase n=1 Tax=Roseibacillus persicicus TaxID=454148 RepID=A0A918WGD4_9BACT|nr:NAD(P)H-dependent oxidoreductase [Roseibacillus persicicus]GHC48901.1 NAD(P)H-dependent oxidoreductase [Roseibacillus persicicus]
MTDEQLIESFNWRYATKIFDPGAKIAEKTWHTLQESMRLSPSSFGLQPWHFVSITSSDLRQQLLPHSWGQKQVVDSSHMVVLCTRTDIDAAFVEEFIASTAEQRNVTVESLKGYRDVVVDFISAMTPEVRVQWCKRQTYLALQRLMDAAALLQVDACPIEGFLAAEYDKILDLPAKNLTATVCCALGYRSSEDKYAELAKSRFPKEKLFTEL